VLRAEFEAEGVVAVVALVARLEAHRWVRHCFVLSREAVWNEVEAIEGQAQGHLETHTMRYPGRARVSIPTLDPNVSSQR
jgi:hypothetical protein